MSHAWTHADVVMLQLADADVTDDVWLVEVLHQLDSLQLKMDREDAERAVNRLIEVGALLFLDGRLRPTAVGRRITSRLCRFKSSTRQIAFLNEQFPSPADSRHGWQLRAEDWERAVGASRQRRRHELGIRKEIVDGLLDAIGRLDHINALVRQSRDRTDARHKIESLGYTHIQAHHILDTTVSRQTAAALSQLRQEAADLDSSIAKLADE